MASDDFFQLVEHASDLILIVREGRIVYANAAFAERLGYARGELIGKPAVELAHPEERDSVGGRIRETMTGKTLGVMRRRLLRKDGSEVTIEASTFPTEFEGAPAAVLVGRDLTEELQRRSTEADFRALVDTMPGGILVHEKGTILYVNTATQRFFGLSAAQMIGTSVIGLLAPSLREMVVDEIARNAAGDGIYGPRELAARRPGGAIALLELTTIPLRFEGRRARLVHLLDMTERRATERRLRALIDSSPLAVTSLDAQARPVGWNRAAERLFGWPPPPAPLVLPEENIERLHFLADTATRDGIAVSDRRFVRPTDGAAISVRTHAAPLRDPEGAVEGFVLTTADVTESVQAQASLQAAAEEWQLTFDAVDAPMLLLEGPEREIKRCNRAAAELLGGPAQSLGQLGQRQPWAVAAAVAATAARTRAPALDRAQDGKRVWAVSASPLREGQLILTLREVTRLVELQDALRRTEAMSAMGALVAGVAHEVRNPLFGMSATLDAMQQQFATDAAQEPFLNAMRRELDRLNRLMRDLLEYGRPPAVQLVMDALSPVVGLAARSCLPVAELASVTIENAVGPDAGAVPMDAGRLAQVFQNLIENAVQHSPAGGKVRIEAQRTDEDARVSVLDSGPGFRPQDLPQIFEPFFSRRRGGTGLGLSIVQRIVEQHHGVVEAANRAEGGARMTVVLPLAP